MKWRLSFCSNEADGSVIDLPAEQIIHQYHIWHASKSQAKKCAKVSVTSSYIIHYWSKVRYRLFYRFDKLTSLHMIATKLYSFISLESIFCLSMPCIAKNKNILNQMSKVVSIIINSLQLQQQPKPHSCYSNEVLNFLRKVIKEVKRPKALLEWVPE